jgi:hypothetical protein
MPNHRRDLAVTKRGDQGEGVAHDIEQMKGPHVAVIFGVPAGRSPVAALVGRDHVESRRGERQHHLAPAVGKLGKAVEQK